MIVPKKNRVLVVEDEEITRCWISQLLCTAGYRVHSVTDARSALSAMQAFHPHVALLDLHLPDAEDFSLTRRAADLGCGVIIVSVLRDRERRIGGLRSGADDYLTKPCDPEELLLKVRRLAQRIHAVTRARPDGGKEHVAWAFDPNARVWRHGDGRTQALSEREARLFRILCDEPGRVFSRDQLKQAVFDEPRDVADRTVDSLMARLRRKLEDNPNRPRLLLSVYGSGYRLNPDP
jgi:two-component system torCAD operon response regulator TorR